MYSKELDERLANSFYIPKTFKIGLFRHGKELYDGRGTVSVEGGFPSCRFRCGPWSELSTFEKLTGFKPTNQTDKAAEIEKTATGAVVEHENVPVSGFTVIDRGLDIYNRNMGTTVTVRDPRGWNVDMMFREWFDMVMHSKASITDDNEIVGLEFIYSWDAFGKFKLISTSSDEYAHTLHEDFFIKEKERMKKVSLDESELEVGTVYNLAVGFQSRKGVIKDRRAVYLGKMKIHSLREYKPITEQPYYTGGEYYKKSIGGPLSYFTYPWENADYLKHIGEFHKSAKSETNVFLILEDKYDSTYGYYIDEWLDHYTDDRHNDFALHVGSIRKMDSVKGKILGKADDQSLSVLDEDMQVTARCGILMNVSNSAKYGVELEHFTPYTLQEIKDAVTAWDRHMSRTVGNLESDFPTKMPSSISEWKSRPVKYKRSNTVSFKIK